MTVYLTQLDDSLTFPSPDEALTEPNGLLAIGGDLSPSRFIQAYYSGIFPWFNPHQPILWWSPNPRGVLPIDDLYINRTLRKFLNKNPYRITLNHAFMDVVKACAEPRQYSDETWISSDFMTTYQVLHDTGHAHSIEVWLEDELVGGLYGITPGKLFCGESMFHIAPNASKVAMVALCQHLKLYGAPLIDCQMQNQYLSTMGIQEWPREKFLTSLYQLRELSFPESCWRPQEIVLT